MDVDPVDLAGVAVLNLMVDALLDFRAIAVFPFRFQFDSVTNDPFCIDPSPRPRSFPPRESMGLMDNSGISISN